jgi:hypothetical protein
MPADGEPARHRGPQVRRRSIRAIGFTVLAGALSLPAGGGTQDVAEGVVVAYQNGELTIEARNAPLVEVLRSACSELGAVLEGAVGATDRVVVHLGPGPPPEVLASLLEGRLNYAVAGTIGDRNAAPVRVIVFGRVRARRAERAEDDTPPPPPARASLPQGASRPGDAGAQADGTNAPAFAPAAEPLAEVTPGVTPADTSEQAPRHPMPRHHRRGHR